MEFYGRMNGTKKRPLHSRSCIISTCAVSSLSCTCMECYGMLLSSTLFSRFSCHKCNFSTLQWTFSGSKSLFPCSLISYWLLQNPFFLAQQCTSGCSKSLFFLSQTPFWLLWKPAPKWPKPVTSVCLCFIKAMLIWYTNIVIVLVFVHSPPLSVAVICGVVCVASVFLQWLCI